jgi:hypothetical protein
MRASFGSHDPNLLGRGDREGKPVVVLFQPGAQIQIVAIHGIGDHPGNGDLCLLDPLHHRSRELTLRLKRDAVRNPGFCAASAVCQPVARQIQLPVEQRVTTAADVGEKYPDLTILDVFGAATLLMGHAC